MKFLIIDDEIYTDKMEAYLEKFNDIYKSVYSEEATYYGYDRDNPLESSENLSNIAFQNDENDANILCAADPKYIPKSDALRDFLLLSIDLDSGQQYDYIAKIEELLKNTPVFIIVLSGNEGKFKDQISNWEETHQHFKFIPKEDLAQCSNEIIEGCKAMKVLMTLPPKKSQKEVEF